MSLKVVRVRGRVAGEAITGAVAVSVTAAAKTEERSLTNIGGKVIIVVSYLSVVEKNNPLLLRVSIGGHT